MSLDVVVVEVYSGVERSFSCDNVEELKAALVSAYPWSAWHGPALEDILTRLAGAQALLIRTNITRLRLVHDRRGSRWRSG